MKWECKLKMRLVFEQNLKNTFSELKNYGFMPDIIARGKDAKIKAILELKKMVWCK